MTIEQRRHTFTFNMMLDMEADVDKSSTEEEVFDSFSLFGTEQMAIPEKIAHIQETVEDQILNCQLQTDLVEHVNTVFD